MVTKKIKHKDATGNLHEYDIGVEAKNVTQDKDHQFVTAEEKEAWNKKQDGDGDASSLSVKFQQASTRSNIKTGEKLNVIFGKIAKWFADFKSHVFLDLVQNATTKDTTRAVSAAVAAELQKQIDSLNSALTYGNSYEPNGMTANIIERANGFGIYIRGTVAQNLGTSTGYATVAIIPRLKEILYHEIITIELISKGIYGQLRIIKDTGAVQFGYTVNNEQKAIDIPKGTNIWLEKSFFVN